MKQLEKELEEAWGIYNSKVQNIADHYFKEFVEPFCKKRNLVFSAGMGTWAMWTRKEVAIDPEDYPSKKFREITEILYTSVGGHNQSLGSIMPEYKP